MAQIGSNARAGNSMGGAGTKPFTQEQALSGDESPNQTHARNTGKCKSNKMHRARIQTFTGEYFPRAKKVLNFF